MSSERVNDPKERLIASFRAGCAREGLNARAEIADGKIAIRFAEQDSAPGDLILHHFGLELASAGARADEVSAPDPAIGAPGLERLANAIDIALRRIRVLLIEHNSYLSGGLPWVFCGGNELLKARGLSIYRFPKLAAVEVTARAGAIRIAFAPGDLGTITSSGFYVPTRFCGDFVATARYELPAWHPGPHTASVALFAQDEPSLHRYYSQRNTDPADNFIPRVLANLDGTLHPGLVVSGNAGWFRLVRHGHTVSALHRAHGEADYRVLGTTDDRGTLLAPDVYFGAKIWSPGRCDGLVAEISELTIAASLASEQPPLPESRPDPRLANR